MPVPLLVTMRVEFETAGEVADHGIGIDVDSPRIIINEDIVIRSRYGGTIGLGQFPGSFHKPSLASPVQ